MFVAIVGPDGVGKSTMSEILSSTLEQKGVRVSYRHWITRGSFIPSHAAPLPPQKVHVQHVSFTAQLASYPRLVRNVVRAWATYIKDVRPALKRGEVVLADRWIYNYVGQPFSVRYYGTPSVAITAMRLSPRPDLILLLEAPTELIFERKQELSEEHIDREAGRWRSLNGVWWPVVRVDASGTASSTACLAYDAIVSRALQGRTR